MSNNIKETLKKIDRKKLTNVQKVFLSLLLREGKWMARTALKVPNVGSRIRDLRKAKYGGFNVECSSASELKKSRRVRGSKLTKKQTFYRLDVSSVDENKVKQIFKDMV